jgi:DNA polymerase-3 subunit epsilon
MMNFQIKRPLVFFDIESTGTDVSKDRIVELSWVKIFPNGNRDSKTMRFNPGVPIPKEASHVHGIYDHDVEWDMPFHATAPTVAVIFTGCDLGGYNIERFDVPLLAEEFIRAGVEVPFRDASIVDVYKIFTAHEPRTLEKAVSFYCGKELKDAHSAEADTMATVDVLLGQVAMYDELKPTVESLSSYATAGKVDYAGYFVKDEKDQVIFNFGKYRGQPVLKHRSFLNWMVNQDFPGYTLQVARELLTGQKQMI